MLKKLIPALLAIAFAFTFAVGAFANNSYIFDYAELLTAAEEEQLNQEIAELVYETDVGIAVVVVDSLGGKTVTRYADDFFLRNNIGLGSEQDGILLLIDMNSRQWHITTSGYCITAINERGLDKLEKSFVTKLSCGSYKRAFSDFTNCAAELVISARNGDVYGYGHSSADFNLSPVQTVLIGFGIGFIIALICVSVMKSKLKTVSFERNAANYLKPRSFRITGRSDIFLYRNLSKTPIPQNNGGGGSRGVSHTHRSGGRSFGGRSGRF